MENALSLSDINANLYQKYGAINPTIMLLLASTYDHARLLSNMSAHFSPLNQFLAHNFEIKERIAQIKNLKDFSQHCARVVSYGNHSVGQYCLGTGGSILASALDMTHNILKTQVVVKLNTLQDELAQPQETQKKKETNLDAVKKHEYQEHLPIYVSPDDGVTAVFEPKTIAGVKGIIGSKKTIQSMIKQMEKFLSLSLKERAEYIDYYTEVKEITKKDAKKDRLNEIMIGQRGIFARRKIPENTFIGFYTGSYCATKFDCQKTINQFGKANYDTYVFGFAKQPLPRINGFHYGNRLTLCNASSCYTGNVAKVARDVAHKTNIHVAYARSGENPDQAIIDDENACDLVMYYANMDIQAGRQMFVDYGMKYWRSKVTNFIDATQEELNAAIRGYRQKKRSAKHRKALG